jgi:hypothetical protein
MSVLRFTNPIDIPAYRDWDFPVFAAVITLHAEVMRDVYAEYLENHRRYHFQIPKNSGRYQEAERVTQLHRMLVEACESGHDVTLDGHDYVWSFASDLMFQRRFISVACPECDKTYVPSECEVLDWSYGEDLAASGGRRVVCLAGHTLYSCTEWDS